MTVAYLQDSNLRLSLAAPWLFSDCTLQSSSIQLSFPCLTNFCPAIRHHKSWRSLLLLFTSHFLLSMFNLIFAHNFLVIPKHHLFYRTDLPPKVAVPNYFPHFTKMTVPTRIAYLSKKMTHC